MKAIVTVIGKDQVGIIAAVCTLLAENNVNVLDISQTILREFFTMTMLVDVSACKLPFTVFSTLLENEGAVQIHADFFNHFAITPYSHETVRTTPHADT